MDAPPRTEKPFAADERATLLAFLDHHRDTLRWKTAGLDAAGLGTALPPSDLTLGALLKHLAYVEDWWFGVNLAGRTAMPPFDVAPWRDDPDWELHSAADDSPEELRDLWERSVAASRETVAAVADLDAVAVRRHPRTGESPTLRWILVHMIEEYARHNGHADLIRQSVDGSVGQ